MGRKNTVKRRVDSNVRNHDGRAKTRVCQGCRRRKAVTGFPVNDEWDRRDASRCLECHDGKASQ